MSMVPSRKALFISGSDVPRLLPMADAVAVLEQAFQAHAAGRAADQPRYRMAVPETREAPGPRAMMHVLGGTLSASGVLGTKTYVTTRTGTQFVVLLFSVEGPLLAVIEANVLGQIRTGAASGVATKHLARPDSKTLAVIGAGFQARGQVEAICAVRPIEHVRVFSRTRAKVEQFCASLRFAVDADLAPADSAEAAVRGADIVVTATTAKEPVLTGAMLAPGMHVNAMGSNAPSRRELDGDAVLRAGLIVADDLEQARTECGDLISVIEAGQLAWDSIAPLSAVVAGKVRRADDAQVTLFESQGLATEDLAVARHIYEAALRANIGTPLALSES